MEAVEVANSTCGLGSGVENAVSLADTFLLQEKMQSFKFTYCVSIMILNL